MELASGWLLRAPPFFQPGCLIQAGPCDPGQASPSWAFAVAMGGGAVGVWGGETLFYLVYKVGSIYAWRVSFYQMRMTA